MPGTFQPGSTQRGPKTYQVLNSTAHSRPLTRTAAFLPVQATRQHACAPQRKFHLHPHKEEPHASSLNSSTGEAQHQPSYNTSSTSTRKRLPPPDTWPPNHWEGEWKGHLPDRGRASLWLPRTLPCRTSMGFVSSHFICVRTQACHHNQGITSG